MTATAHALVGGAIATSIHNPALGLTLSIASHPFLDMIPHWDEGWGWKNKSKLRLFIESSFDLCLGVGLTVILFGQFTNLWYLLTCIFMAVVWDLLMIPYLILNWKFAPFSWIYKIQHHMQGKAKLPWGILTQVVTVLAVILVLQSISPT